VAADNLRVCQPFYSYSTLSWVLLEISRILQDFDESLFLLTFAIKSMKYKVVFSAERRKSKKSGNIITRNVPIRMRVSFYGQRVEMTTGMRIDEEVWNDILMLSDKQKRRNVPVSQKRRIDVALSGVGTDIHSVHKQLRELESRVDGVFQVFNALGKSPNAEDYL